MKTKFLAIAALVVAAFSSCYQSADDAVEPVVTTKEVAFDLTAYGLTPLEVTRAVSAPASLLVLDAYEGTVTATVKESFGNLSMPLIYGKHDLYIVAATKKWQSHDDENLTVTWPTEYLSMNNVWAYHLELTVTATTETQKVTLPWVMSEIMIISQDAVPGNVDHVVVDSPDLCRVLDLKTMRGVKGTDEFSVEINVSTSVGSKPGFTLFSFVPEDGSVGDITLTAYNSSDSELLQRTISGVEVEKGYLVKYTGSIFNSEQSIELSYQDAWLGEESYSF